MKKFKITKDYNGFYKVYRRFLFIFWVYEKTFLNEYAAKECVRSLLYKEKEIDYL